jgi:hypothetical protein
MPTFTGGHRRVPADSTCSGLVSRLIVRCILFPANHDDETQQNFDLFGANVEVRQKRGVLVG